MAKNKLMAAKAAKVKKYDMAAFIREDGNFRADDYVGRRGKRREWQDTVLQLPYKRGKTRVPYVPYSDGAKKFQAKAYFADGKTRYINYSQTALAMLRRGECVKVYLVASRRYVEVETA